MLDQALGMKRRHRMRPAKPVFFSSDAKPTLPMLGGSSGFAHVEHGNSHFFDENEPRGSFHDVFDKMNRNFDGLRLARFFSHLKTEPIYFKVPLQKSAGLAQRLSFGMQRPLPILSFRR